MTEERVYLIKTDRGTWSNHHDAWDGQFGRLIGDRVTEQTANCYSQWSRDGRHVGLFDMPNK